MATPAGYGSKPECIRNVMQRPGDMEKGQGGKMYNAPKEKARFTRSDKLTPRQA